MSPARAIKAILVLQVAIAGFLFARDIAGAIPRFGFAPRAPQITEPIRPGDQTRRFDPARLPARPAAPGTDLPATSEMPTRLQFEPDPADPDLLRLTGTIAPGDAERFADWQATTSATPERIALHSPGGSVSDALAIGRALRAADLATEVQAGDICLSACPYLLAAGTTRSAADDAYVGVHQHFFDENTVLPAFLAVEDIQRGQGEVLAYLDEMGIDPMLMQPALTTPPSEIYILVPEELARYRLVTERD